MHDYNIILGMDWLSKHHAKIDCKKEEVTFRRPQQKSFTFEEGYKEKLNAYHLSLKVARLLKWGWDEYLAIVVIIIEE